MSVIVSDIFHDFLKSNRLCRFLCELSFKRVMTESFQRYLFPGAQKKYALVEPDTAARYVRSLEVIGGQHVDMLTPEGDKIHGMFFGLKSFEAQLQKLMAPHRTVGIFHAQDRDQRVALIQVTDDKEFEHLKSLGIVVTSDDLYAQLVEAGFASEELARAFAETEGTLGAVFVPPTKGPKRVAIVCAGSSGWFSIYKPVIARLLMNGVEVLGFDYRGYNKSEGSPTDERLIEDVETCYTYLKKKHRVADEEIIIYGNCMGAGPGTVLASRYPGINLFIDRSFAEFRNIARDVMVDEGVPKFLAKWLHKGLPSVVDFDNARHLKNAKGHIFVVTAHNDELVGIDESQRLLDSLPEPEGKVIHHLETDHGHKGIWLRNPRFIHALEQFLVASAK